MLACGEREAMVMVPRVPPRPTPHDSAVSRCFLGCLALLHPHFPHIPSIRLSTVNSSPHPGVAPQSLTPAPSCCPFQGTSVPFWHVYGCSKDCLILIPFRLPQISCFTLLNVSPLTQTVALMWGWDPCFSSPTHRGQAQSY